MQVHLTHLPEGRMVTPLNVTAASFLSFSVPSPYIALTAYIAAVIRSLSAELELAFLCLDVALEALGEDFRTRLTVLLGQAFFRVLVVDWADDKTLFWCELLLFRNNLAGETSFSSR